MINTTAIKDRSFVMNITNGNSVSIETRNNKHVTGFAINLTQKHKTIYAIDIEFINGRFVRMGDQNDYLNLPMWKDLPEEEKRLHELKITRRNQERNQY